MQFEGVTSGDTTIGEVLTVTCLLFTAVHDIHKATGEVPLLPPCSWGHQSVSVRFVFVRGYNFTEGLSM